MEKPTTLDKIRLKINRLDRQILALIQRRLILAKKIAIIKKTSQLTLVDKQRENQVIKNWLEFGQKLNLKKDFLNKLIEILIIESKKVQKGK